MKWLYKHLCYAIVAILIGLIFINEAMVVLYKIRYSPARVHLKFFFKKQAVKNLLDSYEGFYSLTEINDIVDDSYKVMKAAYEPWTTFKEPPFKGKWINVANAGFRLNHKGEVFKDKKIFVFGGSTAFGYGVKDEHTVASFMEKKLPEYSVVNYGRAYYYSSLEMQLFLKLLKEGNIPDIAVFIDGLNDTRIAYNGENPPYSDRLKSIIDDGFYVNPEYVPILDLFKARGKSQDNSGQVSLEEASHRVLHSYAQNREIIKKIAELYGVKVHFVWQPIPHYAYNLENQLFKCPEHYPDSFLYQLYNKVYAKMKEKSPKDIIWLADIFEKRKYVYIDMHHYNPSASSVIADCIVKEIREK